MSENKSINDNSPDYLLTLKVQNAPLFKVMKNAGYETVAELSRACGVHQTAIGKIANLKMAAFLSDGITVRPVVLVVAKHLNVHFSQLFPVDHLMLTLEENTFKAEVTTDQLEQLTIGTTDPARLLEEMETIGRDVFGDIISAGQLTEREKRVLRMRIDENMTLGEIAKVFDVSRERARQIIKKALRKLSHPDNKTAILSTAGIYAEPYEGG